MAKMKPNVPDERLDALNKCLAACAETERYLQDCAACHLNVDRELRQNAEQKQIAQALKAKFYPGAL